MSTPTRPPTHILRAQNFMGRVTQHLVAAGLEPEKVPGYRRFKAALDDIFVTMSREDQDRRKPAPAPVPDEDPLPDLRLADGSSALSDGLNSALSDD